jgi:hypothetical protein
LPLHARSHTIEIRYMRAPQRTRFIFRHRQAVASTGPTAAHDGVSIELLFRGGGSCGVRGVARAVGPLLFGESGSRGSRRPTCARSRDRHGMTLGTMVVETYLLEGTAGHT